MESFKIFDGRVHIYRRDNSKYWQCATYLVGKNHRTSTKLEDLNLAKEFAENWYLDLRGKSQAGVLSKAKTFADVAAIFLKEYEIITDGKRSPKWVKGNEARIRIHLNPFFGDLPIDKVTSGRVQEYRVFRMTPQKIKPLLAMDNRPHLEKAPSRSTLHDEIITLRQVLKTAIRHGWLDALPDLSPPYKTQGKISHRAWFSPNEYKQLYNATRENIDKVPANLKWSAEQLHDFVLFMANTGLRPDEAYNLQHRDIEIVIDEATGEKILEIEVRGKRGVGYCKSTNGAVRPYERLKNRPKPDRYKTEEEIESSETVLPKPIDAVFLGDHRKMFNTLLQSQDLKHDRDGNVRTAYSLRHTYICLRLMEGANIYQIAKNCRTSVEMIERFYASHIKNTLDASAINVRKKK